MKTFLIVLGLLPVLALAAPMKLKVDKTESHIDVDVHATVDSFTGHLADFDPDIRFDSDGKVESAKISFKFNDLKTGKDERDRQMHLWQDTPSHPDVVFELISIAAAEDGTQQATGTLKFHGVAHKLTFPVSFYQDGALTAVDGTANIDTRDFDLPVIRKFMVLRVDPELVVHFHIQGRPEVIVK